MNFSFESVHLEQLLWLYQVITIPFHNCKHLWLIKSIIIGRLAHFWSLLTKQILFQYKVCNSIVFKIHWWKKYIYLANATCVFPFAYNNVNYTTCITIGYGFPWCSATPVFSGRIIDCRTSTCFTTILNRWIIIVLFFSPHLNFIVNWCASSPCFNNGTCSINNDLGTFQCKCADGWTGVQCAYRKLDFHFND